MFGPKEMVDKVLGLITDPKQMATHSSAKQIAEVVYEAYGRKSGAPLFSSG